MTRSPCSLTGQQYKRSFVTALLVFVIPLRCRRSESPAKMSRNIHRLNPVYGTAV